EPLRKPPVNRSQQFARLLHLALVAPEPREAHGGAEFPGFRLLLASDREGTLEIIFTDRTGSLGRFPRDFSGHAMDLRLAPAFLCCLYRRHRFGNTPPRFIELAKFRISTRQNG